MMSGTMESDPYALHGCSCRCGKFGFAFVQSRWLLVYYFGKTFKIEVVPYLIWCAAWLLMLLIGWLSFHHAHPNPFEPGQIMFDVFLLVSSCYIFGNILSALVSLPPLFGYMVIGMCVANLPSDPTSGITDGFSSVVKEIALTIIVSRAGLGLPVNTFLGDPKEIRRKQFTEGSAVEWTELSLGRRMADSLGRLKNGLLLAVTPMALEACAYAGMSVLVFGFDILMGFLLGFVMAAVSPAVVVPGLIDLQSRGFVGGSETSAPVPSIVMFASGLDDIFAITFFGIFLGMAVGGGGIAGKLIKAPLEILAGVVAGFLLGYILYVISCRLVPKDYRRSPDPEVQASAQEKDMNRYGMVHHANVLAQDLYKIPKATKSHQIIFFMVFLSCVAFVIGCASVYVADKSNLASMGVLGSMSACLALNYLFSQADFRLATIRNDMEMVMWVQANKPDLVNDNATRRFFNMRHSEGLEERLRAYAEEQAELEDLADRHSTALSMLNLHMKVVWDAAACPLLFALVGKSINFSDLFDMNVLPKALLVIGVSLGARCIGALLACTGSGWSLKNRFFVAFAWMPKATVQAAVGGEALREAQGIFDLNCKDMADNSTSCLQEYKDELEWAALILQISVMGIIITAPAGAAAIALLGPKWLEKRGGVEEVPEPQPQDPQRIMSAEEEGIPMENMDRASVLQFMQRTRQQSLVDMNNTVDAFGRRPSGRDAMRTKRAASFPCSMALGNPVGPRPGSQARMGADGSTPFVFPMSPAGEDVSLTYSERNNHATECDGDETSEPAVTCATAVDIEIEGAENGVSDGSCTPSGSPSPRR